jgi:hypothetical protein
MKRPEFLTKCDSFSRCSGHQAKEGTGHEILKKSHVQWSISQFQIGRNVKLTTHLRLMLKIRMVQLYLQSPISFHSAVIKHRDNFALHSFLRVVYFTAPSVSQSKWP